MQVARKLHVELHDGSIQVGQQVEVCVARAEVVQGNLETMFLVLVRNGLQVSGIVHFFALGQLEDEAVQGKVDSPGCGERELNAGGRAVDRTGKEVDGKLGAGDLEVELGGQGDGAAAAALIKGVEVLRGHPGKHGAGAFAAWTAHQCLIRVGFSGEDVDDGLERHAERHRLFDPTTACVTGGVRHVFFSISTQRA